MSKWKLAVKVKTDLLSEYLIHYGCRQDYPKRLLGFSIHSYYRKYVDGFIYFNEVEEMNFRRIVRKSPFKVTFFIFKAQKTQVDLATKTARRIPTTKLPLLSNQKLAAYFNKSTNEYKKALSLIQLPIWIENFLMKTIEKEFGRKSWQHLSPKQRSQFYSILNIALKTTETYKEKVSFLKLANNIYNSKDLKKLFNQGTPVIQQKLTELDKKMHAQIKTHIRKFSWLTTVLFLGEPYGFKEAVKRIKDFIKHDPQTQLSILLNHREKEKRNAHNTIKTLNISGNLLKLSNLMRELAYFRTARLEWLNKICFYIRPLLKEITQRANLAYNQLIHLFPEEINEFLKTGKLPDKEVIDSRIKRYGLLMEKRRIRLFVGKRADILKEKEVHKQSGRLKGTITCQGLALGKVKIVKNTQELSKVKKGDVLVTSMTTPDYVVAIEKAVAIVTDIGGLTSHAAIISREFNIPCIVGTQIATKVLKDGDLVEVDADKGVVKILKK